MSSSSISDCYASAASTAQLLTTSYVESAFAPTHRSSDWNQATLYLTLGGTTATSIEWKVQFSNDGGTTWFDEMATETSAGTTVHRENVRNIQDDTGQPTTGLTQIAHVPLGAQGRKSRFRIVAKRTGGDATTSLLGQVAFARI